MPVRGPRFTRLQLPIKASNTKPPYAFYVQYVRRLFFLSRPGLAHRFRPMARTGTRSPRGTRLHRERRRRRREARAPARSDSRSCSSHHGRQVPAIEAVLSAVARRKTAGQNRGTGSAEFRRPVAGLDDLLDPAQQRRGIAAVEGAVVEALPDHGDAADGDAVALRPFDDDRCLAHRIER